MGFQLSYNQFEQQPGPAGEYLVVEHKTAYHKVARVRPEKWRGRAVIEMEVYSDRIAGLPPAPVLRPALDEQGRPDYRNMQEYIEGPTLEPPLGRYEVSVEGNEARSLLNLDDPIPAPVGTATKDRWSREAQAYRLLHSLPEFAAATRVD